MAQAIHYTELIRQASEAEAGGELEKAAELYEKAVRQKPFEEKPYARLMKIYRQFRDYDKELKVIDRGLQVFQEHYDNRLEKSVINTKAAKLSKALLRAVEGKNPGDHYYPEPVPKWMKRRLVVEKRLGKV
jgi:tetratricopeptide (TPR) repeat protein